MINKNNKLKKDNKLQDIVSNNTKVTYYKGVGGLKKIYEQTLKDKNPIFALTANILEIDPELRNWLTEKYVKKRKENKIFAKVISPKTGLAKEYLKNDKDGYRKTLLIPKDKFPISIEINIFGNKVGLMSYKKNELMGTVIESKEIAKSMRVFFDLAWEKAQDYQKESKDRI